MLLGFGSKETLKERINAEGFVERKCTKCFLWKSAKNDFYKTKKYKERRCKECHKAKEVL